MRLRILCMVILAMPITAAGQIWGGGGRMVLFSDAALTDSTYQDQVPGSFTVYVVHLGVTFDDAWAVRFMVEASAGVTFLWVGESSPMPTVVGDSRAGITIDYGACLYPDPGLILEIQYVGFGSSQSCSALRVVPHPAAASGEIEVFLCIGVGPVTAVGRELIVNCPVPIDETTWGKIKALYQ